MDRKEAKELLPIIQAFAEGKHIQWRNHCKNWIDVDERDGLDTEFPSSVYRIKPEPKYRPFKSIKECIIEMLNHPDIGYIIYKDDGKKECIKIGPRNIDYLRGRGLCDYNIAFEIFTFTDGNPFGVKEEQL